MTTTINASNSGSGGLVQTADASGVLALQTAGTTALSISAAQVATFANAVGGGMTVQVFTSGSGTYTLPASCKAILIRMVGGGGGGGSATATGSGAASAGGGGASGGYVEHLIASPSATYSYAVGAAGAINGGTGGNTTFGTSLLTTNGGTGGQNAGAGTAAFNIGYGGDGGTASGGNILNIKGSTGGFSFIGGAVQQTAAGFGGMSLLGHSANNSTFNGSAGTAGLGYGSGGSGGQTIANQSAQNGGAGASGAIIVLEFYV
jgi:hypothetical protein